MKECLFHSESNNVAAYCLLHQCGITVKQMRCKNCLQKQCRHLAKNEEHQYWRQREFIKQKRKDRKEAMNKFFQVHNYGN